MIKIRSNKWYGRFWPPERRKVKILQTIVDSKEDEIIKASQEALKNKLIFGFTESDGENLFKEYYDKSL